MAQNKITDLRDHLFETIEKLKAGEIDLERAKVIADVSQVIVNSAKVEVDMVRSIDALKPATLFFNSEHKQLASRALEN